MTSVLVFDIGGVLYDFRGDQLIAETSRRKRRWRTEEVQALWLPLVHSFETGAQSEADFAATVVRCYDLTLTPEQFLSAFRAAAHGFYEGARSLLRAVGEHHHLLSLSNTNGVQWPKVCEDLGAADPFHAHHPSHISGFLKPDVRAFEAVARSLPAPRECFFFDDRAVNVAAAARFGWRARRVRGVAEARSACLEFGLIEPQWLA